MALQLTGAFKEEALANLQLELPAVVIGGGLTAIDTATELLAYYPIQAEKTLARYATLCAEKGEDAVRATFDPEERDILDRLLAHGLAVHKERERAARRRRDPRPRAALPRMGRRGHRLPPGHGGVPRLPAQPRGDHQGPRGRDLVHRGPRAAGSRARRARQAEGDALPARRLGRDGRAAGADLPRGRRDDAQHHLRERVSRTPSRSTPSGASSPPTRPCAPGAGYRLEPAHAEDESAFFTGFSRGGKFVTFFGDNHPAYNGNVVKAMASARNGYREIARVVERRDRSRATASPTPSGTPSRAGCGTTSRPKSSPSTA